MDRIQQLSGAGVSIWLDTLSRELIESGRFEHLVRECAVTGATSNPTIFERAISGSATYDDDLRRHAERGLTPRSAFFKLALEDVRSAAALLRPAYEASDGGDGYVSFEVTPDLAGVVGATVEQALAIERQLGVPNVMVKVPATRAGLKAIERLTFLGVNVNVTLLFAVERYEQVVEAYLRGLERRLQAGRALDGVASVASFFVSRIDVKADAELQAGSALRGRVAVANARRAHSVHRGLFGGARWARLRSAGAREQRLLWASTATKDPVLSDVHYVERLIAPDVINTMPEATLAAFADHGRVAQTIAAGAIEAAEVLAEAAAAGIDLDRITSELEAEGVAAFCDSYQRLLQGIESKLESAPAGPVATGRAAA